MKIARFVLAATAATVSLMSLSADKLVIVATNDTHSQIDPDNNDRGGILRRKVLVDSVRNANSNVLLVDAGDAVQGTLYFNLYRGEVEHKMMNLLGYDIAILGNHDFDNGVDELAENLRHDSATWITTNYDLRQSALNGRFLPYQIRKYGDKSVGIIGINLQPKGMISEGNYDGVKCLDPIKAANSTAWHLKHNEGVDYVVAVTHIGYDLKDEVCDVDIARNSEDIDLIIGGHSHDAINPNTPEKLNSRVANAIGDTVVITQAAKAGRLVAEVTLDLDNGNIDYRLVPVDSRLDKGIDPAWQTMLQPYRHGVDSLMQVWVATAPKPMANNEPPLLNMVTDFVKQQGDRLNGGKPIDMALMNAGGLRTSFPKGKISEGMVINLMPFNNHIVNLDIKGADLLEALNISAARRGGDGVSKGVEVEITDTVCSKVTINGESLQPERIYRIATIDYLANGGDYLEPLKRASVVAQSDNVLYNDLLKWLRTDMKGRKLPYDTTRRMSQK